MGFDIGAFGTSFSRGIISGYTLGEMFRKRKEEAKMKKELVDVIGKIRKPGTYEIGKIDPETGSPVATLRGDYRSGPIDPDYGLWEDVKEKKTVTRRGYLKNIMEKTFPILLKYGKPSESLKMISDMAELESSALDSAWEKEKFVKEQETERLKIKTEAETETKNRESREKIASMENLRAIEKEFFGLTSKEDQETFYRKHKPTLDEAGIMNLSHLASGLLKIKSDIYKDNDKKELYRKAGYYFPLTGNDGKDVYIYLGKGADLEKEFKGSGPDFALNFEHEIRKVIKPDGSVGSSDLRVALKKAKYNGTKAGLALAKSLRELEKTSPKYKLLDETLNQYTNTVAEWNKGNQGGAMEEDLKRLSDNALGSLRSFKSHMDASDSRHTLVITAPDDPDSTALPTYRIITKDEAARMVAEQAEADAKEAEKKESAKKEAAAKEAARIKEKAVVDAKNKDRAAKIRKDFAPDDSDPTIMDKAVEAGKRVVDFIKEFPEKAKQKQLDIAAEIQAEAKKNGDLTVKELALYVPAHFDPENIRGKYELKISMTLKDATLAIVDAETGEYLKAEIVDRRLPVANISRNMAKPIRDFVDEFIDELIEQEKKPKKKEEDVTISGEDIDREDYLKALYDY